MALSIPVRPIEEIPNVAPDRGRERSEARIVAGAAQVLDRSLGEILAEDV